MKITKEWLEEKKACREGIDWFVAQIETDGLAVVKKLMAERRWAWANWLIVRIMNYRQYVSYAVFAAELVLDIFEKRFPDDKRPREAIEAAKKCLENPSEEKKHTAYAAYAAADAAHAAYTAYAADAAHAAHTAYAAAYAADAAHTAYIAYAAAAAYAAADARKGIQEKIINYGISLLEKREAKQ